MDHITGHLYLMGITLWYSPLPNSNFNTQFNYLVSAINTLVFNNEMNIMYNEFNASGLKGKESSFNDYGFEILPCHMTLMKNIPDDEKIFNKLMRLILAVLHTDSKEMVDDRNKYSRIRLDKNNNISFNSNIFFKNCVLEVDKTSISVLLSMIKIINEHIPEIPLVDIETLQPHISLCYSNNKLTDNKELQNSIKRRLKMYLDLQNNELDWGIGMGSLYNNKKIGRFYLVRCEGPVDTWKVLRALDI
ncbi:hypothetical protein FOG48_02097 [Hanseniaspora uvarum]|nr:hypothetical protein FOG48_02097 [Hanseniaspora uvarum]